MKQSKTNKLEKFYFLAVAILFVFLAVNTFGQTKVVSDLTKHKYAAQNLAAAIHSSNLGVRESAIYLVGEYRFVDFENELIKQLRVENDSDIKILIGLALFRLNSEKGIIELQRISVNDQDQRVRKMSKAIYNEFYVLNSNKNVNVK